MKMNIQLCMFLSACLLAFGCGRSQYQKGEELAEQLFVNADQTNLAAETFNSVLLKELGKRTKKDDKEAFVSGFSDKGTKILVDKFQKINSDLGVEVFSEQDIHKLFERLEAEATNPNNQMQNIGTNAPNSDL